MPFVLHPRRERSEQGQGEHVRPGGSVGDRIAVGVLLGASTYTYDLIWRLTFTSRERLFWALVAFVIGVAVGDRANLDRLRWW